MDKKYITFYNKFIRHSKTLGDGGIVSFAELFSTFYDLNET